MKPANLPARHDPSSLPTFLTHAFNIGIPVLYAVIFATPLIGMIAAIEPAL